MPEIISVSKIDFPHKAPQSALKDFARKVFSKEFDDIERLLVSFDNSTIETRNLSVPVDYFYDNNSFEKRNELYQEYSLKYSVEVIENCLSKAGIDKSDVTDLIFISTTGISTPSIDALLINQMKLNENVNRYPVWGLGCAGGVSGISKARTIAKASPSALVLLVCAELCSLTFIRSDVSKSNFIASGLFSDGVAAAIIAGDEFEMKKKDSFKIKIIDSKTKLYYESLEVMGWEILDEGFKVMFSKDIPAIVKKNVNKDISEFLCRNNLSVADIKNFVIHPGGIKVINAYTEALDICEEKFRITKDILKEYGNMSSATVLYVLDRFIESGFDNGPGLMMSLGPGFSSDSVLLDCAAVNH